MLEETKNNDLIGENYKNVSRILNDVENFFILFSSVKSCPSVSAFGSRGIASSAVALTIFGITAGI